MVGQQGGSEDILQKSKEEKDDGDSEDDRQAI